MRHTHTRTLAHKSTSNHTHMHISTPTNNPPSRLTHTLTNYSRTVMDVTYLGTLWSSNSTSPGSASRLQSKPGRFNQQHRTVT